MTALRKQCLSGAAENKKDDGKTFVLRKKFPSSFFIFCRAASLREQGLIRPSQVENYSYLQRA